MTKLINNNNNYNSYNYSNDYVGDDESVRDNDSDDHDNNYNHSDDDYDEYDRGISNNDDDGGYYDNHYNYNIDDFDDDDYGNVDNDGGGDDCVNIIQKSGILHYLLYPGRIVVCFHYFKVAKAWRVPWFRGKCRRY